MSERLTIYADRPLGRIAPEVYGHFIEHLGHCIYGGLWVGEDSTIPQVAGIRQEAIDVFRAVRAPVIRWPGGYFADCYDWRDGIGPRDDRPVRFHECEPDQEEPNHFGTHEFLHFCELVGAEPNICANTASLGPQAAMDWVEYCNHDGRTAQAQLRRGHGRPEPWHVKYWAIGNESYWLHRPQDYIQRYLLWRKFMRRVDPNIQCIASLLEPTWHPQPFDPLGDWLQEVVAGIRGNMELASLHLYSGAGSGDEFTEAEYWSALVQIDQRNRQRIESFLGAVDSIVGSEQVKLALDEWGLWHPGASMTNNCEQPCTQRDALFAARYFHLLQRYPTRVGLATIAQSVNVLHALLRTDGPRTYRTPTFHVFEMFRGHQGAAALELIHSSPLHEITEAALLTTERRELDLVTASASLNASGDELLLTLTNADLAKSHSYQVEVQGGFTPTEASVRVLAADPHAQNTYDAPEQVRPTSLTPAPAGPSFTVELPACSVVAVAFKGEPV